MKKTTKAIEDYLEAFYILYLNKEPLESARVSRLLGVSRPAVNKATHEMMKSGYINKTPYSEIEFTPSGKRIAKKVYHRHTTLKKYLLNLGVSEKVSSFVLPLGATINMDGTSLYQGVCALFVAQAFGIPLSVGAQVGILITATLASIGTAGVPGAGLIMLSMVLTSAGLPIEGIGLVAGIDAVLDMARTAINVTGDSAVATVVASWEGEKL